MPEWPGAPISPAAFFEGWLPETAAELLAGDALPATELTVGIRIEAAEDGEGGEWTLSVREGRLHVAAEPRDAASLTIVQSLADWQGALWGERGGVLGRAAVAVLSGRATERLRAVTRARHSRFEALEPIQALEGLVRFVLTGDAGGDWSVAVKLGPGVIPDAATATVAIQAEDAAAIERGELAPLQAFMAGRIQVVGDMTLMMQLQAILMQVAEPPPR